MAPPPRRTPDHEDNFTMEGAGLDDYAWGETGFDLNSQAQAAEDFPGLQLYGNILQGDDNEVLPAPGRGSGLRPYRPPRAGAGDARATAPGPYARQLLFGGSSSAAAGRGGGNCGVFPGGSSSGAGSPVRQRANSAAAAPGRRPQRTNSAATAPGRRPRAPRAPNTHAVRGQPTNTSGAPFDNNNAAMEDDVEELASSGGPREEDHGPMDEEEEYAGGSSSEDKIISMCRNNLVQQQNLILQLVPILGWPGSAHDMRVFKDAITSHHHKFPHPPPGKYYVVDAGYPNRPGYLSPYRCTRYHVEQWHNGPPPQGMKEIFNHAHAKVRNVIERTFGVLKMKFRILLNLPRFSEEKQTRIIVACMALHNFIRDSRIADREFDACDADENYNPMPSSSASTWAEDDL